MNLRKDQFQQQINKQTFFTPCSLTHDSSIRMFLLFLFFFSHQPLWDLDANVTSLACKSKPKHNTPFNDGPLGSRNDEERGKMRKCSMNCRIYWIIDSLNAHCAEMTQLFWHARLSLSSLTQHVLPKWYGVKWSFFEKKSIECVENLVRTNSSLTRSCVERVVLTNETFARFRVAC